MAEEEKPKCCFCGTQENVKAIFSDSNELQCLACDQCLSTKVAKFKHELPVESIKKLDEFYVKEIGEWENKFKTKEGLRESKKGFE